MKKLGIALAAVGCLFTLASCKGKEEEKGGEELKVAMVTDYGDITDQSFNQATYEGCQEWCTANNVQFKYYKPASNSDADRATSMELAIAEGYNVIVMPGYAFANAIDSVCFKSEYSSIKFIALDVAQGDLWTAHYGDYESHPEYVMPSNLYCAVYQEEICGYFAGYAAVCEGYTKLGFLGGMSVPAVQRYGYGFVQGCEAAANEKGIDGITVNYVYGGQFFGDEAVTAVMDTWYQGGTEVVFACGGGIYTSAAEAAKKVHGKVIGVDVDQKPIIDGAYEAGMCITSAMKGLNATVKAELTKVKNGEFESKIETLGLVSATEVGSNFVQLPVDSWCMTHFTANDYKALVADIFANPSKVSNSTAEHPTVSKIQVNYQNDIH